MCARYCWFCVWTVPVMKTTLVFVLIRRNVHSEDEAGLDLLSLNLQGFRIFSCNISSTWWLLLSVEPKSSAEGNKNWWVWLCVMYKCPPFGCSIQAKFLHRHLAVLSFFLYLQLLLHFGEIFFLITLTADEITIFQHVEQMCWVLACVVRPGRVDAMLVTKHLRCCWIF